MLYGERSYLLFDALLPGICLQVGLTGSDVLYGVDTVLASTVSYILHGGCHGVRAEDCLPSCHSSIPAVGVSKILLMVRGLLPSLSND